MPAGSLQKPNVVDLAIAYRIYPRISKTPAYFSDDKFRLSTLCLHSFKRALGDLHVKIWVLLDGCPREYEALFCALFSADEMEIIRVEKIGNLKTFSLQLDLLTRGTEAPFVYFAEDDYFYMPNAIAKMVAFARSDPSIDFVTPYDHSDLYTRSSSKERHLIRAFGDRHWRTVSSTCLTFLASRESLIGAQRVLRTYTRGNNDCSVWLALTKKASLFDFRVHWSDMESFKIWLLSLKWGIRQILSGKRYSLWSPLPTVGTHMESSCVAPLVQWEAEFLRLQDESLKMVDEILSQSELR